MAVLEVVAIARCERPMRKPNAIARCESLTDKKGGVSPQEAGLSELEPSNSGQKVNVV